MFCATQYNHTFVLSLRGHGVDVLRLARHGLLKLMTCTVTECGPELGTDISDINPAPYWPH